MKCKERKRSEISKGGMSRTEEIAASSLYMTPVVYGKEEDMNIDDIQEVNYRWSGMLWASAWATGTVRAGGIRGGR